MTVETVHRPERRHHCGPGDYGMWLGHIFDAAGTVLRCDCGRTWVAFRDHGDPGYMGVKWRREGWFARRRRERKTVR